MGCLSYLSEQTKTFSFCSFDCSTYVPFSPLVFKGELDKESEKKQHTRNLHSKSVWPSAAWAHMVVISVSTDLKVLSPEFRDV